MKSYHSVTLVRTGGTYSASFGPALLGLAIISDDLDCLPGAIADYVRDRGSYPMETELHCRADRKIADGESVGFMRKMRREGFRVTSGF